MKKDKSQNPMKSFKDQILGVFFTHVKAVLIIALLGLFILGSLLVMDVVGKIVSVTLLLIYGLVLYSSGYECAEYDLRSYTKTTSYLHKGFYLSLLIPISNLLIWILMKFLWSIDAEEAIAPVKQMEYTWWPQIPNASYLPATAIAGNIIFVIWTFPYNEFMNFSQSYMSVWGHVLMYVFPVLCVTIGYVGGLKKWDLSKYLNFLVYEKNSKNDDKKS